MFWLLKKNKRGYEKILSMYWFVMIFIVVAGVFTCLAIYYSSSISVRNAELDLMLDRIANCIDPNGYIDSEFLIAIKNNEEFSERFLEKCSLNIYEEKTLKVNSKKLQYYIKISLDSFNIQANTQSNLGMLELGDAVIDFDCSINNKQNVREDISICKTKYLYLVDKDNNSYIAQILVGVSKTEYA